MAENVKSQKKKKKKKKLKLQNRFLRNLHPSKIFSVDYIV